MCTYRKPLSAALAAALVGASGACLFSGVHTRQHETLVTRELTGLSSDAEALRLLAARRPDEAQRVLQARLQRSVADLEQLTLVDVQIDDPSLVEGLWSAYGYARSEAMAQTAEQAARVLARLVAAPAAGRSRTAAADR